MTASERSVMSGRTSFDTSSHASAPDPANWTSVTVPTSMPARRTGVPAFTVAMLAKRVFSGYRCQANPPAPPTANTMMPAMAAANTVSMPIFSSENARERVRGIGDSPRTGTNAGTDRRPRAIRRPTPRRPPGRRAA